MRVLYITANPKLIHHSVSLSLGELALQYYRELNPSHITDRLDLTTEEYPHLNSDTLSNFMNPHSNLATQSKIFKDYDKYIIVAPMWNLTVPSALKAYLDTVIIPNVLFRYTEQGTCEGLCGGKMIYIGARGGDYSHPPQSEYAFDDKYMEGIAKMIGLESYQSYVANAVGGYRRRSVAQWVEHAKYDIEQMVTSF
ncbi:FMN-dependent NADH-azoreductase [Photobacterium profundum]|uniref:FMN-dependent NADH:quinone oxidoreductase 2 n=1 Tax=Photobacterium profundum (strain SS9) TaxID=298386 RepID=AZOR2_PHOPR|nr:NAD(P)H-dependent oxidoreductase [Photobacterium profundum]Q6LFW5.1 RecName: Full=FMN-dependent NADH:quinone oxidoreductase 2; AltName: Full=Azo-dye reductase 2; AltName: Full=FMN-dependent NADH-azo compound oxidoreductase 2; AltName: Full=FMN-dependent NADH-azoreductase 2 [Photobacterium profundum SS9]CAG23815.1 hypothetical protein PBPRB1970 [Photobacterium profundum SS9]